ncbi:helix-turn-helix transcriptional regulator [Pseudomonas sp. zfem005]|uniref:helix-turn-helix domain-containing protein n=1 Tax=Pseudomonas sp. zfem005 TaxID=3078200 RepID=UPI002927E748|nr:helix-turn-helix transcriptional regulator [Pseudomonas sp. zfem005]MDU9416194.1 helix-turn-helix transcriptional regulator [Pseudomonas sp. zfem005]
MNHQPSKHSTAQEQKARQLSAEHLGECAALKAIYSIKKDELGLTQEKLAKRLGMRQGSLSHYLNGRNSIGLNFAIEVARELGVRVGDFSPRLAGQLSRLSEDGSEMFGDMDLAHNTSRIQDLDETLHQDGWSCELSVDMLQMFMSGWEKARRAGLLPEVTQRPAGIVEGGSQIGAAVDLNASALKDFTGGGMVHAPARRAGVSRHGSDDSESVARHAKTLLDYFQQFPGWEGFLGAMGEAFMREYSARTDEQAGHYAGMVAALSVPLAPQLKGVLSGEQRKGLMRVTITTADFVMRQLTVSVTGDMPCTDGQYLLIPEATDGQ